MSQSSNLAPLAGRVAIAAISGVLIAVMGTALVGTLVGWYPESAFQGRVVLLATTAVGACLGSILAIFAGKLDLGDKAKNIAVGVLVGAVVGFVAAIIAGHIAAGPHGFSKTIQANQFDAGLLTIPVGCLLGGVLGAVLFKTRRANAPESTRDPSRNTQSRPI